jgi:7-cyano-7-deazaguanine synthase
VKTVVLLSGGLDSTVALAYVIETGDQAAMALSFDYGQTHRRELNHAELIADYYDVNHRVIDLRAALKSPSALTGIGEIPDGHADDVDATFVPGRNLTMIAVGIGIAAGLDASTVVIGANADDQAGFPDCRPEFITSVDNTARTSTGGKVGVWAPLLSMTKVDIVNLGRDLGVPFDLTYSCYRGGIKPCNRCGACESRNGALL